MPSKRAATGQRLDPDVRRTHLLRVGAAVFAEKPYDEVRIEQIAKNSGVSRGLLYHYFPTKRDFFIAIVTQVCAEILEQTKPNLDLPLDQRLRASLDAYIDYVERHTFSYRAVFRSTASADGTIQQIVNDNLNQQVKRIIDTLRTSEGTNTVLQIAVRSWLAFQINAVLDWLDNRSAINREQLRELCVQILEAAIFASTTSEERATPMEASNSEIN